MPAIRQTLRQTFLRAALLALGLPIVLSPAALATGFAPVSASPPAKLAQTPATPLQGSSFRLAQTLTLLYVDSDPYCQSFSIQDVAVSPDDRRLAVSVHGYVQRLCGGGFSQLSLWNVDTGERVQLLVDGGVSEVIPDFPDLDDDTTALAGDLATNVEFTPDGTQLVAAMADRTVRIWDGQTGQPVRLLQGHTKAVRAIAISPDGSTLFSGGADQTIRVWDLASGKTSQVLQDSQAVREIILSPDGQSLISVMGCGLCDTTLHLWRKQGNQWQRVAWEQTFAFEILGEPFRTRIYDDIKSIVRFGLGGQIVVTGDYDGNIRLWDAETGVRRLTLRAHTDIVNHLAVTPDGQFLASNSDATDGIRLWNLSNGRPIRTLPDGGGGRLAFSHDDRTLMMTDLPNGETQIWNWRLPQQVETLPFGYLAISPSEQTLVKYGIGYTLEVWQR